MKIFFRLEDDGVPPNKWHIHHFGELKGFSQEYGRLHMFCGEVFNEFQLPYCRRHLGDDVEGEVCQECMEIWSAFKLCKKCGAKMPSDYYDDICPECIERCGTI